MSNLVEVRQPGRHPLRLEVVDRLDIGRECDGLLLVDERVSRRHLRLEAVVEGLQVTDLGSSNGTYLDGERLQGSAVIGPDTTLRIGSTSILVMRRSLPFDEPDTPPGAGQEAEIDLRSTSSDTPAGGLFHEHPHQAVPLPEPTTWSPGSPRRRSARVERPIRLRR